MWWVTCANCNQQIGIRAIKKVREVKCQFCNKRLIIFRGKRLVKVFVDSSAKKYKIQGNLLTPYHGGRKQENS
jgi:DNA-directed RNA polymerase subunit RPC12/RpoP